MSVSERLLTHPATLIYTIVMLVSIVKLPALEKTTELVYIKSLQIIPVLMALMFALSEISATSMVPVLLVTQEETDLNATTTLTVAVIFSAITPKINALASPLGLRPIAPTNLIVLVILFVCATPSLVNNSVSHQMPPVTVEKTCKTTSNA